MTLAKPNDLTRFQLPGPHVFPALPLRGQGEEGGRRTQDQHGCYSPELVSLWVWEVTVRTFSPVDLSMPLPAPTRYSTTSFLVPSN